MSEEAGLNPIKAAIEAIKAAVDVLHPESEKGPSRAGPLVVVGRFYISLTLILGVVTSVGALIDWKSDLHEPSYSISVLRLFLLGSVVGGLVLSVVLLAYLVWRHTLLIFSPSELSENAQASLLGPDTKDDTTATQAPPPPPPTKG